jgi:hypothetical protein
MACGRHVDSQPLLTFYVAIYHRYKSVVTQITYDVGGTTIQHTLRKCLPPTGNRTSAASHTTSSKKHPLNHEAGTMHMS